MYGVTTQLNNDLENFTESKMQSKGRQTDVEDLLSFLDNISTVAQVDYPRKVMKYSKVQAGTVIVQAGRQGWT